MASLRNVQLFVREGEAIAIVGRNGSGKSSLLRLLAGLTQPTAGTVRVLGVEPTLLPYAEQQALRRRIGFVFDRLGIWDNRSVLENITLPADYHEPGAADAHLEKAQKLAGELGILKSLALPAGVVDESVRKRAMFARALLQEPQLLLVDEPQVPLTPEEARLVRNAIEQRRRSRNLTVVYVDHDGDVAPFKVDRYVYVADGVLESYSGPPDALKLRLSEYPRSI